MRDRLRMLLLLTLPLLVPLGALVAGSVWGPPEPGSYSRKLLQILSASLLYGGVPYVFFVSWVMWRLDRTPESVRVRQAMNLPLQFAAWFALCAIAVGAAVGGLIQFFALAVTGAVAAIAIGYSYVALVLLVLRLSTRFSVQHLHTP